MNEIESLKSQLNQREVQLRMVGKERDELIELRARLVEEREGYRSALKEILGLCQITAMSFEAQAFEATKIAQRALKPKA